MALSPDKILGEKMAGYSKESKRSDSKEKTDEEDRKKV